MSSPATAPALDDMPLESMYTADALPLPALERGQLLFRTLGTAEIHIGDGGVITPGAERMFSLLAVVGMSHEHVIARESLMELVWPGMDDASARHSLRQHVYKLRQLGVEIEGSRASVRLARSTFLPCFALDRTALLFDRDVLKGQEPFGHLFSGWLPSHAVLRRWVEQQRELYHADVRRILVPELRRLRDRGEWEDAERWARTVLEFDPYNEDATLIVAEAVAMLGSRVSATSLLESYVRETGVGGTELGRRVEKAQQRIERAGRLTYAESATTPVVGRDDLLKSLDALTLAAMQGEPRIVHLLGPAGIGKTELAYEVTRRAVILGFARCLVRASHFSGTVRFGLLSHVARNLLKLPGALGCSPDALALVRRCAGSDSDATAIAYLLSSKVQLHECFCELLSAISEETPLVILVDDFQRVDPHSADVITQLGNLLQNQRVLLLVTERDQGKLDSDRTEDDARCVRVVLPILPSKACIELASSVASPTGRRLSASEAAVIAAASDNTPLGIIALTREHLVTGLTEPSSSSLSETLARQIRRLRQEPRFILSVVAVLGGKASPFDLDDAIDVGLETRIESYRLLLECGLLSEGEAGDISCHDEVRRVALQELASTELQVLRRQLAKLLGTRLRNRFTAEDALRALTLALDSSDTDLFTQMCLEHADRLSNSGMADGVLRFLEAALNLSSDGAVRTSILTAMVLAAERAYSWRLVARATDTLRGEGAGGMPLSPEHQLAEIEASVHTDMQGRGRQSAELALAIAADESTPAANRVRALRVALSAASDLFESDIGIRAYAMLTESLQSGDLQHEGVLEPIMQFNAMFGDLEEARCHATDIHTERMKHSQSIVGLRLLTNASLVLRLCGDIGMAMDCLTVAERSRHVQESPSRLLDVTWRKTVVAFEGRDKRAAIELGKSFITQGNRREHVEERWVKLFNLRLEHLSTGRIAHSGEALGIANSGIPTPSRTSVYCTALCLHATDVARNERMFNELLDRARRYLAAYGRYTGQDFLAATVLERLESAGDSEMAIALAKRYFGVDRRELSEPGFVFDRLSAPLLDVVRSSSTQLRKGSQ